MPSQYEVAKLRRTHRYRRARAAVLQRDRGMCWLCGRPGADTVDHVVPLSLGGDPVDVLNMRAAHRSCNSRRGAAIPGRMTTGTSRQW